MEINDRIRLRRQELGLTLEDVGKVVGVGKSTVRKWESGDIANMRSDKIEKLAQALYTTPAHLMGWPEKIAPPAPAPTLTRKDKRDIQDALDEMKQQLLDGDLLFDGNPVSDEDTVAIITAMETAMNIVKQKNKNTYTPKKYRKE